MTEELKFEIVRQKLDQAVEILRERDVDLWLTFVRETSHVKDPCLDLILGFSLTWQSALMVSQTGERIAIVGRYDADNIARVGGYGTVVAYDHGVRDPLLAHLSRLSPRQIAVNFSMDDSVSDGLSHGMYQLLEKMLRGTLFADRLVSSEGIVGSLRGRKSQSEISRIKAAIRKTETLFCQVGRSVKAGMTQLEVARAFKDAAMEQGVGLAWDRSHCPAVTAGPESPVGHAMPGSNKLAVGQLLQVDFGVKMEGFVCDLQRTWYLLDKGESSAPADVGAAWRAASEALEAGRKALRPGARGWEVDEAARGTLVKAGYPEYMHAFGHHIGRTAHDGSTILGPRWERYGASIEGVVEAGNVFAIELGIAVPGRGYIGREEDVLVTDAGAEYLSDPQTELWCVA